MKPVAGRCPKCGRIIQSDRKNPKITLHWATARVECQPPKGTK